MLEYKIEDDFDTTLDHYWSTFFSPEFNAALWKHLDIDHELLELVREGEGQDEVLRRRQKLTPRRDIPALLRRIVTTAISYEERNVWRRRDSRMEVVTIPSFMSDRVDTKGIYEVAQIAPGKVRRTWTAHVGCTVALVGGTVEKHIVGEVKESYAKTTAFMRKWLAEHPAPAG